MPESIDIRPNAGRNSSGKRMPYVGSTNFEDPYKAAKAAVRWWEELQEDIDAKKKVQQFNSGHSLAKYWEIWWGKYSQRKDKSDRNKRDNRNRWYGSGWGLGEQEWSKISIDEITQKDIADYFSMLDARGDGTKGWGAETKKNQKSLLNKLNREAINDFPNLRQFVFPKIEAKQQVAKEHFDQDQWKALLEKINELSGGVATKDLSFNQYENLVWTERNKCNQRNWVDLYDVLTLMFYFFLRSEDVPRLQMEWFTDVGSDENGNPKVVVYLEKTKKDRLKQETEHIFPDGYKIWNRISKRRPSGYISFPYLPRKEGAENESHVGETANVLLKEAAKLAKIKKRGAITLTTIRHTSFRLTLEEMPPLRDEQDIRFFADNGNTGVESLRKTYLKYTQKSSFLSDVRKSMPKQSWAFFKGRVSLDE